MTYESNNTNSNRQDLYKAQAEYTKWLKMQEDILRQKARTTWADEGDTNSKYFYRVVNEKRRSSHLPRFKNNQEVWVEGNQDISNDAIQHFSNLFTHSPSDNDLSILECIDLIVSEEENNLMHSIHEVDAIKDVVFSINPNSFTGPDGFNGHFCQASWDIIKEEVCNFVKVFFKRDDLLRFFTHTNLFLIPKVTSLTNFAQLRPISMCNVSNKIISKIIARRIANLLPKPI